MRGTVRASARRHRVSTSAPVVSIVVVLLETDPTVVDADLDAFPGSGMLRLKGTSISTGVHPERERMFQRAC